MPTSSLSGSGPRAVAHPAVSPTLHALFFFSGMASLACEVVWFKQLGFVLGSSTFSASVVVSCFFGGLSLGSMAFGRMADRVRHPLVAYGAIELTLAVTSLAASILLSRWEDWIGWFTPLMSLDAATSRPIKIALALPILLPPTVLMGATLPVLSRYLVRSRSELAARIGALYALNTLGASFGCLLVGWVTIGWMGLLWSAAAGSALYAGIGVVGLALARATPAPPPVEPRIEGAMPGAPVPALLVAVFSASGFLAIGYEVLWFRMLRYHAAHTVYTFSTFLSVYLLGLVLGAAICARWLAGRKAELGRNFAMVQLGIGIAALVSFAVLGRSRNLLAAVGAYSALDTTGLAGLVVLALVVLLPSTILLGLAFPLASELVVVSMAGLGGRIGLLYGLNTLGGVLGSLLTGFVLLPWLGAQLSFEVLISGNLLLFAAVVAADPALRHDRALIRSGVLAVVTMAISIATLGQDWLRQSQTAFTGEVLDFRENEDAAFVVMGYEEPRGRFQQLIVNGTSYANNRPPGRRYMAVLGHLPMLLHPDPEDALVICIGTGTTIGAVSLYPEVDPVYAVDLSRHVFELAPHFVPINNRFYENPRVRPIVADGRHFLLVTDRAFDVLTFEPPPPQQAGVVNLYSREFYRLADAHLEPDGVLAQWIPFHQGYRELQGTLIRTMYAQFEHVSLWLPNGGEGVVIASHSPLEIDPERIAARMADPVIAADLRAVGIDSVEDLLAMFVSADDQLSAWVGDVPDLTDDHPTVEYFFGYRNSPYRNAEVVSGGEPVERRLSTAVDPERLDRARTQIALYRQSEDARADGDLDGAMALLERALSLEPGDLFLQYERDRLRAAPNGSGDPGPGGHDASGGRP